MPLCIEHSRILIPLLLTHNLSQKSLHSLQEKCRHCQSYIEGLLDGYLGELQWFFVQQ